MSRMREGVVRPARPQRGYSLIEVLVALVIGLFLLGGILTILQTTRNTSSNQSQLAQLQDEERVAMTLMTDAIQQAGYFPNADQVAATTVFLPDATFGTAGQIVAGQPNSTNAAYGDTVTIRYEGDTTNSVVDCRGQVIPNGTLEEMTFQVKPQPGTNQPELMCTVNGADSQLVLNVQNLQIFYGVDTNGSGSVNAYLPASQMAAYWTSVYSVKISVTFGNPLFGQPGQTSSTITFTRVIGVMSALGANVFSFT